MRSGRGSKKEKKKNIGKAFRVTRKREKPRLIGILDQIK